MCEHAEKLILRPSEAEQTYFASVSKFCDLHVLFCRVWAEMEDVKCGGPPERLIDTWRGHGEPPPGGGPVHDKSGEIPFQTKTIPFNLKKYLFEVVINIF